MRWYIWLLAVSITTPAMATKPRAVEESPLPNADYGVSTLWPLGGSGGWDQLALDPNGNRLFVSRGDRVDVIGASTGRRSASIANTAGVHGIAFAPELKRGFTSNGRTNSVSVFDLDSLRVLQEVSVAGSKPDAILYESRAQHVFVANAASSDMNVLDAGTYQTVATIALSATPRSMVGDGAETVYVNLDGEPGKLATVDARTLKVRATWSLPGCANPTGLAIDVAHRRLFSACGGESMVVTDMSSGRQIARVAIGDGCEGVAFDADLGFIFAANGRDGTLTVIHEDTPDDYRVIATVQTQQSARTLALDPTSHKVYLPAGRLTPPPPPSAEQPNPRPGIAPDSFVILVAEPK